MEIGHPSATPMNNSDTSILGRPAGVDAWIEKGRRNLFRRRISSNRRVIVFDLRDRAPSKRMWGTYGKTPVAMLISRRTLPAIRRSQLFRNPLYAVQISCRTASFMFADRVNDRIQRLRDERRKIREGNLFWRPETLGNGSAYDLAFSHDAAQKYLLVADGEDNVIWTLLRSDGSVLKATGHAGRGAGQFHHVHAIVSDSKGNLYTGEVETGRRVQRFTLVQAGDRHVERDLRQKRFNRIVL